MGQELPLKGLRVIDMSSFLAAPFCATLLGDFGAEVFKVEMPKQGDAARHFGQKVEGQALFWLSLSRNKKSITCDLRKPEGQELIKRLISVSDIVAENFRPGTLEKWNLGYEQLKEKNPGIIMVRISGWGQTGPYRRKPSFGRIAAAFGGLTYITGYPDRAPVNPGTPSIPDYLAGVMGALGAVIAKIYRDRTGQGQEVDIGLYEPILFMLDEMIPVFDRLGYIRERSGPSGELAVPHSHYQAQDRKWLAIACTTQLMFERLCKAMGKQDLLADSRFKDMTARIQNQEFVDSVVQDWVAQHPAAEIIKRLDASEVPTGLINSIKEILEDEHVRSREDIIEIAHPTVGKIKVPGIFPKLTVSPGSVRTTSPITAGEHNDEVYGSLLGLSKEEISDLREREII